jgi:hypothetical protein
MPKRVGTETTKVAKKLVRLRELAVIVTVVAVVVVVGRVVNQPWRWRDRLLTTRVIGRASLLTRTRDGSTIQLIVLDKRIPKLTERTLRRIKL